MKLFFKKKNITMMVKNANELKKSQQEQQQ